ncbi:MAG: tetratricopeptide repeat protein [Bacteroidetes bacterium]|nr:tetratricopeptide repeat protein [Bacteroidota bacterium]
MRYLVLIGLSSVFIVLATHTRAISQTAPISFADSLFVIDLLTPRPIEELIKLNEKAKNETEKLNSLLKICLSSYADFYQIRKYVKEALILARKMNARREIGLCYVIGIYIVSTKEEVDSCASRAEKLFEETGSASLYYLTKLYSATTLYRYSSDYVESFRQLELFINNYKIKGDRFSMARAYNIKGEIYRTLQNYPEALKNYRISSTYTYLNGVLFYPSPLINMGTVYKEMGNYDSALYYYDLVLNKYYKDRVSTHAYLVNRKAQVYLFKKNYSEAILLANGSLKLYKGIAYGDGIVFANSNLTTIYFNMGDMENCIHFGEQTYQAALEDNYFPSETQEAIRLTALAYSIKKNYAKAYQFQQVYIEKYQKFFGQQVNVDLFNEQLKLDHENQLLERKLLIEKQRQTEEQVVSQRKFNIIFIAALLISVVGSAILFKKNKTIRLLNRNLIDKQNEILAQSEELKATNDEIEAINSNLERIVIERNQRVIDQNKALTEYAFFNAHKVRGPLARILGLINVFEKELANHSLQDYSSMLKQAGKELDESIKEINKVLEKDV